MNPFNTAYLGQPPWDIGQPQGKVVELFRRGEIRGAVLDAGCGTGDNALFLAAEGLEVWGIDSAPLAIEKAKAKARERGLHVVFREFDALSLFQLGRTFETVIDCGLFHTLDDAERALYADSLLSVLDTGGTAFILCFSEREPPGWGPRRVTQDELRATFHKGWEVVAIREAEFTTTFPDKPRVRSWLATVRKITATTPGVW